MPECTACESQSPEGSRFCLDCGSALEMEETKRAHRFRLPESVSAPAPLTIAAIAIAVGAVILLAGGVWAWGIVAFLAAAVLVLLPRRVDRRTVDDLRLRASAMRESVTVRGRGQVDVFRARRELAELEAERGRLYHELGRAVYEDDETGMKAARTALDAVVGRTEAKEGEIATLIRETEERVRRAQGSVQPTEVLHGEAPPEPPRVPEPWPPPDEGDIPEPPQPGPGAPTPGPNEPAPPVQPPGLPGDRS